MECPPRSEESSGVERMVFGITTTEPLTLAGVSFLPVVAIPPATFLPREPARPIPSKR